MQDKQTNIINEGKRVVQECKASRPFNCILASVTAVKCIYVKQDYDYNICSLQSERNSSHIYRKYKECLLSVCPPFQRDLFANAFEIAKCDCG